MRSLLLLAALVGLSACEQSAGTALTVSVDSLNFLGFGAEPAPIPIQLSGVGGRVEWTATSTKTWLTILPASGATPSSIVATANTTGLSGGEHVASASFLAAGAQLDIPVRMVVPSLNGGTWSGTVVPLAGHQAAAFTMTLTETAGVLAGSGTATPPGSAGYPLSLSGQHVNHPEVVLTFTIVTTPLPLFTPFTFTGAFSTPGKIVGTLTGSGYTGDLLTLTR